MACFVLATSLASHAAQLTAGDTRPPIVDGTILASARDGDIVYLAGRFEWAAIDTGYLIAYDKTTGAWKSDFPFVNGPVQCAISDGAGGFYIGGDFTEVGGLSRPRVAHILADGAVDAAFRAEVGLVRAEYVKYTTIGFRQNLSFTSVQNLLLQGGRLYIAGAFDRVGGQPRLVVAAVSATSGALVSDWQMDIWNEERLGQAVSFQANIAGTVHSIESWGAELIIGGRFSHTGKLLGTSSEKFKRTSLVRASLATGEVSAWDANYPIVRGVNTFITSVWSLGVVADELYANGAQAIDSGSSVLTDRFDLLAGTKITWNPAYPLNSIYPEAKLLGAVGRKLVYKGMSGPAWIVDRQTGALDTWKIKTDPNQVAAALNVAALEGDQIWLDGRYTLNGTSYNGLGSASLSDGLISAWKPSLPPMSEAPSSARPPFTTPSNPGDALGGDYKCMVVSDNTVLIGGERRSHGAVYRRNILAWNARTGALLPWRAPLTPYYPAGPSYASNSQIRAVAVSTDRVFAGGDFRETSGSSDAKQEHLVAMDKTTGGIIDSWAPKANGPVNALFLSGDALYVGGEFSQINSATRYSLAAVSATTGTLLPWAPEAGGIVQALASTGTRLWAAGNFTTINDQPRRGLAEFDLTTGGLGSFAPAFGPSPASRPARTLALRGNTLYAGGDFESVTIDGMSSSRLRVAAFDISNRTLLPWNPRANEVVNSILPTETGVWLAGKFKKLGPDDGLIGRRFVGAVDNANGVVLADDPNRDGSALLRDDSGVTNYPYSLTDVGATVLVGFDEQVMAFGSSILSDPNRDYLIEAGATQQRVAGGRRFEGAQPSTTARVLPTLTRDWTPAELNSVYTYTLALPTRGLKTVTLAALPPGLAFDISTLTVSGTPVSLGMPSGLGLNANGDPDPTGALLGKFAIEVFAVYNDGASKSSCLLTIYQPGKLSGIAPAISTHPASRTISVNQSVTFTVVATGNPSTFTYRWQSRANSSAAWVDLSNASPYSGVSTAALALTSVTANLDGRQLRCIVSNGVSPDATSNTATLTVTPANVAPMIVSHPQSLTVNAAQSASFSVSATGTPSTFAYQWQRNAAGTGSWTNLANGGAYSGVGTTTLTLTTATFLMNGDEFRCLVSNGVAPSATSNAATLTVRPPGVSPNITTQPLDRTVEAGQSTQFVVEATGSPSPSYQWQRLAAGSVTWLSLESGGAYRDTTTRVLTIIDPSVAMEGDQFRCIASNGVPADVVSLAVTLHVTTTKINTAPTTPTNLAGIDVTATSALIRWTPSTDAESDGLWYIYSFRPSPGQWSADQKISLQEISLSGLTPATEYSFAVRANDGKLSSSDATVSFKTPTIPPTLGGPEDVVARLDTDALFTISATGSPAVFKFKWRRIPQGGGAENDIPSNDPAYNYIDQGPDRQTLVVRSVTMAMSGDKFQCIVSNADDALTISREALLTVGEPPEVTGTEYLSIAEGATDAIVVNATGRPANFEYRWERLNPETDVWEPLEGDQHFMADEGKLTIKNAVLALHGTRLHCVVSNGFSPNAISKTCVIAITGYPKISEQPRPQSGLAGETAVFKVIASSPRPMIFQWEMLPPGSTTWMPVVKSGRFEGTTTATTAVLKVKGSMVLDGYRFRCVVDDGVLHAPYRRSNEVELLVTYNPMLEILPVLAWEPITVGLPFVIYPTLNWQSISTATSRTRLITAAAIAAVSFTADGLPAWASFDPASGAISGTVPANAAGSVPAVVLKAWSGGQVIAASTVKLMVEADGAVSRIVNLSTRGQSLTNDNVLISGFVISGTGGKKILVRGVGPTLGHAPYNVTGALVDPRVTLKQFNSAVNPSRYDDISISDNWADSLKAAQISTMAAKLGAFGFEDAREAAVLVDLNPGLYTVITDGVSGATGISLVELYDADESSTSARLVNISSRGICGVGDQVMIFGFVISQEGPKTLLVRVVGPTLAGQPYNVAGTLNDPKLTVHRANGVDGNSVILTQDNWGENADAAYTAHIAQQVGAFPLANDSKDAAAVVTLSPGVYSVVSSSAVNGETGVVLVEVYAVP